MSCDLLAAFEQLKHPRVLVLGDFILDRYTWGNAERVSQEAPVILLRADTREARLGGAANVCAMLRGLEAEVTCAGVVGDDADGQAVRALLHEVGADAAMLLADDSRPTTVKERFIGRAQGRHPHQILRVDHEVRDPLSDELEARLGGRIIEQLDAYDVVLVSDYDKGVCTPRLLRLVIDHCRAAGIPVLVDPIRTTDYARYRGATTMKANRIETGLATGIAIETPDDALRAGRKLCRELKLDMAIVTLDRDGMALVYPDGRGEIYATQPRAVYDITGAGDMVLAMVGLCAASGLAGPETVRLANLAGGMEVEKVGVVVIPRAEMRARLLAERSGTHGKLIDLDQACLFAQAHRALGERVVLAGGCFDLLHVGHVRHLEEAARLGDVLIVAVNSDASVRRLKGGGRPVIMARDRAAMLAALGCVHYVIMFDDSTPAEIIRRLRPEVLVKGGNYREHEVIGNELVAAYGGAVRLTSLVEGISTSGIVSTVQRNAA